MKKSFLFFIILFLFSNHEIVTHGYCNGKNDNGIIDDNEINICEDYLIKKYGRPNGKPKGINIFKLKSMPYIDLYTELRKKINEDVLIKEYIYGFSDKTLFFWLIKDNKCGWKVISNIQIPINFYF